MQIIKELQIMNKTGMFFYKVGGGAIQHSHKIVTGITHQPATATDQERFIITLDDQSIVTWNADNVCGFRASHITAGVDNVTD